MNDVCAPSTLLIVVPVGYNAAGCPSTNNDKVVSVVHRLELCHSPRVFGSAIGDGTYEDHEHCGKVEVVHKTHARHFHRCHVGGHCLVHVGSQGWLGHVGRQGWARRVASHGTGRRFGCR